MSGRFLWSAVAVAGGSALAAEPAPARPWPGPTAPEALEARLKERGVRRPTEQDLGKIEAAAPERAPAKPAKPRKVLCWGRLWTHEGNAFCEEAIKILGKKTGAFETVATDDPRTLLPESLKGFDAVFLNNLHDAQPFLPPDLKKPPPDPEDPARQLDRKIKQALLAFVREDGKGVAGVHGAIAALKDWKEFGEMMGAFHGGHFGGPQVIKAEEPDHPLNACFDGKPLKISDESYVPGAPFSRQNVRVLTSLDLTQMKDPAEQAAWLKGVVKGREGDYPISWIKPHGRGRVFYCALGHSTDTYLNPLFLRHLLAGLQCVIGDLEAPAEPRKNG